MSYDCDRAQENISAYVDGELGTLESIRLKLHTLKCEKCREDLNFEKDLVRTMSTENFFLPHDFSESLHKKLEAEYTRNPVKSTGKVEFKNTTPTLSSVILNWINGKKAYLALGACLLMFVFAFSTYQFAGNNDIASEQPNEPAMVYSPKGMARVANMEDITDENIASQEIAGANQNVFDKFRNKYMTKKFVANFSVINDTVGYSTTQKRGITSIMRTIKDVVTDAVSGKNVNTASLPRVNTSVTSIAYSRPATASSKIAVDLREKVPVSVDDESMYGVLMVANSLSNSKNNEISTSSAGNYDLKSNTEEKAVYSPEPEKSAFVYSDIVDYSTYSPASLSVKSATFTADKANISAIKDILYEFKSSIEIKETDSNISIAIDSVNYEVLVSRLKMSSECAFKQVQGRDYSMSYNNLVKKQDSLMKDPSKYSELEDVTKEIEELLLKLGNNTIKINFD